MPEDLGVETRSSARGRRRAAWCAGFASRSGRSELHHLEVFLARAALRAGPVGRHVLPPGSRRDAVVRRAGGLVVDPAADEAHVLFHGVEDLHWSKIVDSSKLRAPAARRRGCVATPAAFRHARRQPNPASPDRAHLRRDRSVRRRRAAGRHADARQHGLPSAVGAHGDHRAGHARRRGRAARSTPTGSPTRRAACSRTCRSTRSRSACWAASRTSRRSPRSSSDYPDVPLVLDPVLRLGARRRARDRRDDARDARAAAAADDDPHAQQHRGAAPRRAATTATSRRSRSAPSACSRWAPSTC